MILPFSAHPAFTKGAQYFDLKVVEAPLKANLELDVDAYKRLITDNTVLMIGSAPSFTLGMIDPIGELAPLALERNINFHVDSCIGGYFLPFVEKLGYDIPIFDFRVPGVTSNSAALHTSGSPAKGAPAGVGTEDAHCNPHHDGSRVADQMLAIIRKIVIARHRLGLLDILEVVGHDPKSRAEARGIPSEKTSALEWHVEPLVRIECDAVGPLDAGELCFARRCQHRKPAIRSIDVQPDLLFGA